MAETKEKDIIDAETAGEPKSAAKPRVRKKAEPKEKAAPVQLPEDPAELAKYKADKLNALIEKGKKAGKLTS